MGLRSRYMNPIFIGKPPTLTLLSRTGEGRVGVMCPQKFLQHLGKLMEENNG